jgi:drug/metabolite transporter (DMT)-like permease/SAM-dependent methyltransferase
VLPRVLLLVAVVIWGWTFVATKILLEELGPVEIFALRLAIGVPFLGLVLLARRVPWPFTRGDARPLILAAAMLTLHFLVQIVGLMSTTATNTSWIISVSPLAVAALSFIFLGERIGRGGVAGIAIATAGILLLVSRGRVGDLGWLRSTGDWLVLASAHTWAVYTVMTRNLARRRDPVAVAFGILLIAGAFTAVLFVATADLANVRALSPRGLAALLYLAIPGLAVGQWFWQEGVARLGAARAGLFLYLEPVATVALAVPLLGESFGLFMALGGGLVLAGVYVGQQERGPGVSAESVGRVLSDESVGRVLSDPPEDVPYTEDLQSPDGAKAWADNAERRRPARAQIRRAIGEHLEALAPGSRVLELGSGPGLLAEHVLSRCPQLASYTLFDFSEPMLEMSRTRVGSFAAARFVLGDFRSDDWTRHVAGPYDAVVSMQAVHEVRHTRHVPRLYQQIRGMLASGGLFLVCDRTPEDDSPRSTALFMTAQEQEQALRRAGFVDVQLVLAADALAFCTCRKPSVD